MTFHAVYDRSADYYISLLKLLTLFDPVSFWIISRKLIVGRAYRFLAFLSPAAFIVFLSHAPASIIIIQLCGEVFHKTPVDYLLLLYWLLVIPGIYTGSWILKYVYQAAKARLQAIVQPATQK